MDGLQNLSTGPLAGPSVGRFAPLDAADGAPQSPGIPGIPGLPAPAQPKTLPAPTRDTDERPRLARRYRVLVHNDDRTPMDFVVGVLTTMYRLGVEHAIEVMLEAHRGGVALVVVLGLEEAEFRVERSHSAARMRGFPLTFSIEPE